MGVLGAALRKAQSGEQVVAQGLFHRTRKGKVNRAVKERYLRDDVGLGRLAGRAAIHDESELSNVLGDEHVNENGMKVILFLDTNVVLRQMDVLEREDCPPFNNVVLCDTVLKEVRRLSLSVFNRLLLLLRDDKRFFIAFPNENHRETWSSQKPGESPNDYNDRLIRKAAAWYREQVEDSGIAQVTLLTNDRKCKEAALNEGLRSQSIQEYVATFASQYPGIVDLLADSDDAVEMNDIAKGGAKTPKFDSHLSLPEINRRLKAGLVHQGTFRSNPFDRREGTVMIFSKKEENGRKIRIRGIKAMNRATEGDRVAIQLISNEEFASLSNGETPEKDSMNEAEDLLDVEAAEPGEASLAGTKLTTAGSSDQSSDVVFGKVVGVIKRNWRQYCAAVDEKDATKQVASESVLVLPVDPKMPKIRIKTKQLDAIKNQRILVAIDSWDRYSSFPSGHFIRAMGPIGDRETETAVILHEHDIPTKEFSRKVMKCLPVEGANWKVTPENSVGRVDLRHLPVCSIDPPGCKDIDDALHVLKLENGNLEIGVHIADVTHFVRPGTEIDIEAANRGTSTYLVERRLDMLPGLLTTDICSLKGKVDRFAFSVIWEFTPPSTISSKKTQKKGKSSSSEGDDERGLQQVSVRFCKSIIHSKAALSYGEAQAWLEDPSVKGELPDAVRLLDVVAKVLRQRRTDRGALTLASQEVRFKLDNDSHDPTDVEMYQQKDANMLVEEFMLLANITVAKRTVERFPSYAMLRRHPKPSKEMFDELLVATKIAGVKLEIDTSKALADSLDRAVKPDRPFFNRLLRILTTRCMMQAVYFTSGEFNPSEYGHYGLASDIYTHFTSPIRRYADVIVHRLLAAAEGIDPLPVSYESKEGMKELSDNLNKRHHMAQLAGRASIGLHTVVFFRNRPTDCIAMVSRVREKGIVVVIPEYGIEGKINFAENDTLAKEHFKYDSKEMRLEHISTKMSVQVFEQVKVHLEVENRPGYRENLVISLVEPKIPMPSKSKVPAVTAVEDETEPTPAKSKRKSASISKSPAPSGKSTGKSKRRRK